MQNDRETKDAKIQGILTQQLKGYIDTKIQTQKIQNTKTKDTKMEGCKLPTLAVWSHERYCMVHSEEAGIFS